MAAVATSGNATEEQPADFIAALADPDCAAIDAQHVAIVVAHPDDETLGCGAQLARLQDPTIVVVTDGSPHNGWDAREQGFAGPDGYARERAAELRRALTLARIAARNIVMLGIVDQAACSCLTKLTRSIHGLIARRAIRVVLTHAYEGGHPDHDATAFAVHAAARLRRKQGERVTVFEMPLYRAGQTGWVVQEFLPSPNQPELILKLNREEQVLKRRMFEAYATQSGLLSSFAIDVERFRAAPPYDFSVLPANGVLLYEQHDWGMCGKRWLELTGAALHELGLGSGLWH